MNKLPKFPYINAMLEELNGVMVTNPNLVWSENDPPSSDILEARLRAKMYGAEVITTRHFLRMVLNSQYDGGKNIAISPQIMEFAQQCIRAMFHSAQAFWGIKGGRLVVTNVWGTSHAYVFYFSLIPFIALRLSISCPMFLSVSLWMLGLEEHAPPVHCKC